MKADKKTHEDAVNEALAKKNYGPVKSIKPEGDNRFQVEAHKLHPVYPGGTKEPLYVSVPVSLSVSMDDQKKVHQIEEKVSPDVQKNADTFVNTLIQNNQLRGMGTETTRSPTHEIEVNAQGQKVVKRRGFSAF